MGADQPARATGEPAEAGCLRAFEGELEFVYRALRRQGVRASDLDDLAQDVFLVLWRRWRELDHDRPLRPWLSGVILKLAQAHHRREGRFEPHATVDCEDTHRAADDQLDGARARALVGHALATLTAKQRAMVVMHDLDGRPIREIAAGLGVPLFTAYTRLRDGRRSLAAALERRSTGRSPQRARGLAWVPKLAAVAAVVLIAGGATIALRGRGLRGDRARPPVGAAALAQGLVGYWSFDDPAAAGADLSGGGNGCLLRASGPGAGARPVAGVVGGALALDGRSWLECPRVDRLAALQTELSISLWIRADHPTGRQALVTRQLGTSGDRLFSLRLQDGQLEFLSHVWKTLLRRPLPAGGWTHLAAVRDARGTRLYVDGVLAGRNGRTTAGGIGGGSGALVVGGQVNGAEPGQAQDRFRGALDELRLYDRALSEAEIVRLAAAPAR